jgi:hypothetical protein
MCKFTEFWWECYQKFYFRFEYAIKSLNKKNPKHLTNGSTVGTE